MNARRPHARLLGPAPQLISNGTMNSQRIYFEDLQIGMSWQEQGQPFTKERMIAFAREFDPVPMHIDEEAAKASYFGGLIASGAHVFAVWRRLNFEIYQRVNLAIIAGAGFDEFRLRVPVRPGDVLLLKSEIVDKVTFDAKPDRGRVHSLETLTNQDGRVVVTMRGGYFAYRRPG